MRHNFEKVFLPMHWTLAGESDNRHLQRCQRQKKATTIQNANCTQNLWLKINTILNWDFNWFKNRISMIRGLKHSAMHFDLFTLKKRWSIFYVCCDCISHLISMEKKKLFNKRDQFFVVFMSLSFFLSLSLSLGVCSACVILRLCFCVFCVYFLGCTFVRFSHWFRLQSNHNHIESNRYSCVHAHRSLLSMVICSGWATSFFYLFFFSIYSCKYLNT